MDRMDKECEELRIDKEDAILLKNLMDKPLKELYAIHYIYSRMSLCSWHYVPDKNDTFWATQETYKGWIDIYENKIKPYLTDEIIDAICKCEYVGSDLIEVGTKGYNLCKIFNYYSTEGTWDSYPKYYEVKEKPSGMFNPFDFVCLQYGESILPYICRSIK